MHLLMFVLGFILLIGIIIAHEWGHYIAAKRNGVKVEEFGLGLPPRATSRRAKSGMILSLNWLPLGAFVKLKGEHDDAKVGGSFGKASLLAKTKILLGGVVANLIVAVLMLTALAFIGLPKLINQQTAGQDQFTVKQNEKIVSSQSMVLDILPDSPAKAAGLASRDIIKSIGTENSSAKVTNQATLHQATTGFAGEDVKIDVIRNGQNVVLSAKLLTNQEVALSQNTGEPKANLGVSTTDLEVARYTWSAPIVALGFTKQIIVLTLHGLWDAVSGFGSTIAGLVTFNHQARENGQTQASSQVGGPVAIINALWSGGALGFSYVFALIAVISLGLAIFNVLPIPALDGGRLFVIYISRVGRFKLTKSLEETIHGVGMLVLLLLAILITIVDVKRFI